MRSANERWKDRDRQTDKQKYARQKNALNRSNVFALRLEPICDVVMVHLCHSDNNKAGLDDFEHY